MYVYVYIGYIPFNQPVQTSQTKSLANLLFHLKSLANPLTNPTYFFSGLLGWLNQKPSTPFRFLVWFRFWCPCIAVRLHHSFKMEDRLVSWFLFTFVSITQLHSHLTTLHELLWPHSPRFNKHEPFKVWQTGLKLVWMVGLVG